MPRTGAVRSTRVSRWSRSTTPSRPSTASRRQSSRPTRRWCGCSHSADELGIDPERIGVAGTSAGGNIAAALTLVNRDRTASPAAPADARGARHRPDRPAPRPAGDAGRSASRASSPCASCARSCVPICPTGDGPEPYASPLRAASHEGLPPAVILTAEYDPLRGDGAAYAAALRRAGVEASAVQYLGVTHDTPIFTRRAAGRTALACRRRVGPAPAARALDAGRLSETAHPCRARAALGS